MRAAILAAGEGERLRAHGVTTPKPLTLLAGQPLIARLLRGLQQAGIGEIVVIVNQKFSEVIQYCRERDWGMPVTLLSKSTAHSLESFLTLQPHLDADSFLLCTVDAVFPSSTIPALLATARRHPDADGVLGVTPFVDDEKPLWAMLAEDYRVAQLGPAARNGGLVTAGVYWFSPRVFREAETARRRNLTALRQFFGYLVESGYVLYGHHISKVIDVDRPSDIAMAEAFLAEEEECLAPR
jgi:NDP-sugar pyrophosphorylase family protein